MVALLIGITCLLSGHTIPHTTSSASCKVALLLAVAHCGRQCIWVAQRFTSVLQCPVVWWMLAVVSAGPVYRDRCIL
jgi:hypothetical protein